MYVIYIFLLLMWDNLYFHEFWQKYVNIRENINFPSCLTNSPIGIIITNQCITNGRYTVISAPIVHIHHKPMNDIPYIFVWLLEDLNIQKYVSVDVETSILLTILCIIFSKRHLTIMIAYVEKINVRHYTRKHKNIYMGL